MNYFVAIFAKAVAYVPSVGGINKSSFATLEEAKSSIGSYIGTNKAPFNDGYTAYIIDRKTNQVVSVATVPEPTLSWTDFTK